MVKSIGRSLTRTPEWKAVSEHFEQVRELHLRDMFRQDPTRGESMNVEVDGT